MNGVGRTIVAVAEKVDERGLCMLDLNSALCAVLLLG